MGMNVSLIEISEFAFRLYKIAVDTICALDLENIDAIFANILARNIHIKLYIYIYIIRILKKSI